MWYIWLDCPRNSGQKIIFGHATSLKSRVTNYCWLFNMAVVWFCLVRYSINDNLEWRGIKVSENLPQIPLIECLKIWKIRITMNIGTSCHPLLLLRNMFNYYCICLVWIWWREYWQRTIGWGSLKNLKKPSYW